jgi:hypothetical protein
MIGKHIANPKSGGSFGGLIDYISGKSKRRIYDEKIAFVDCVNLVSVDTSETEMEAVSHLNKRCANPVMHLLMSWREGEIPTKKQVSKAVNIILDEMNLSQCQTVYALHKNTDNVHLHICVNRVDPDTLKAINPAHGWTRRGMERAARRIEHSQGWKTENNVWSVVDGQGKAVNTPIGGREKIPQSAKDKENLTGEQSAIRKAQEALKPLLKGINGWGELHKAMRALGMEYERKGSGAVIRIGDAAVKASSVSRNLVLAKLEKTFGEYEPPAAGMGKSGGTGDGGCLTSEPKPIARANDNALWREYISGRERHFAEKKEARRQLGLMSDGQKREMKQRHAAERKAMYESCAGMPRRRLNDERKALATRHAYEVVLLKEAHKEERQRLQAKYPAYPATYEQWLRERSLDAEADGWRHRKDSNYSRLELSGEGKPKGKFKGLPGFGLFSIKKGEVRFFREGTPGVTAFVDCGKTIRVYDRSDDAILAALQLGQHKWGGVRVNGTEDYKRRCTEIAVEHGIRVTNPELRHILDGAGRQKVAHEKNTRDAQMRDAGLSDESTMSGEVKSQNLAMLHRASLEKMAVLQARRKELDGVLAAEADRLAVPEIEKIMRDGAAWRELAEAAKEGAEKDIKEMLENPPSRGFFGFGYENRKKIWEGELKAAEARAEKARAAIEAHDKEVRASIEEKREASMDAARAANPGIARELEGIASGIDALQGEERGMWGEARALLDAHGHRHCVLKFPQVGGEYKGEVLGVVEHGGHFLALQEGPRVTEESGADHYGRALYSTYSVVWVHEIRQEEVAAIEGAMGRVAAVTVREDGRSAEVRVLPDARRERDKERGFSR